MGFALRVKPYISMSKLAEYQDASAVRRRRIILDLIHREAFKIRIYEAARPFLVRFFEEPAHPTTWLRAKGAQLRDRAGRTEDANTVRELTCSAQALEAFATFPDGLRSAKVIAIAGPRRDATITLGGVPIGVNPDIAFIEKGTDRRVGAVNFTSQRIRG